jgi:hypothetical protein
MKNQTEQQFNGVIVRFNKNPQGSNDGLTLKLQDSEKVTQFKFPADSESAIAEAGAAVGDKVSVSATSYKDEQPSENTVWNIVSITGSNGIKTAMPSNEKTDSTENEGSNLDNANTNNKNKHDNLNKKPSEDTKEEVSQPDQHPQNSKNKEKSTPVAGTPMGTDAVKGAYQSDHRNNNHKKNHEPETESRKHTETHR